MVVCVTDPAPQETVAAAGVWSVGELAHAAGVTVRTLHHYDRIGLLRPADRSGAGHRRYDHTDVRRLYEILALRSLGFELATISELLADHESSSLLQTARKQLQSIEEQVRLTRELREKLRRIVRALETAAEPSTTDLLDAMEATTLTVRLSRIYTRGGDNGETSLGDGMRVRKTHPVIDAGGTVDELNSHIGLAVASGQVDDPYAGWLRRVQNELFDVGADITVPPSDRQTKRRLRLTAGYVSQLEQWCDQANEPLEPLDSFIVPGASPAEAQLHVARAVCRRAERRVLEVEGVNPEVVRYLNRLSDLLFLLARSVASDQPLWQPALTQST